MSLVGFFDDASSKTTKKKNTQREKKIASKKEQKVLTCATCALKEGCITPRMPVYGNGEKGILIVGEFPLRIDDEEGIPFQGRSGRFLQNALDKLGVDLKKDCWVVNAVRCCPGNAIPDVEHITACRQFLIDDIERLKPKKILLFGRIALISWLNERETVGELSKWFGRAIPDQRFKSWVFVNMHPTYVMREDLLEVSFHFNKYLKEAISFSKEFETKENTQVDALINPSYDELKKLLTAWEVQEELAIDFETTGIKPWGPGHDIWYCGLSDGINSCSFDIIHHEDKRQLLIDFLNNFKGKLIAHNLSYEQIWAKEKLDIDLRWNFSWDTLLSAHVLNTSKASKDLKFQTFANFGIEDWGKEIHHFLETDDDDSCAVNRIAEADPEKTMLYNALDAFWTYKLREKQGKELGDWEIKGANLLIKGAQSLSLMTINGLTADTRYFQQQDKQLNEQIANVEKTIKKTDEYSTWVQKEGTELNTNSTKQLKKLFYDYLKLDAIKQTKSGANSVDEETLDKLDSKIAKLIVEKRKLMKIQSTYVRGFLSQIQNGKIHCFFHLGRVVSFRSSSSDPNFQNIPKRDEMAMKLIRAGLTPSKGNLLIEGDYAGIEVRISACYHKDPEMIRYINDKNTDMHRDQAMELFLLPKEQITKPLRHLSKNKFVFPEFYGDWYGSCAQAIWKELDKDTKSHLRTQGIRKLEQFTEHVKAIEDRFWNKRFRVYAQWKDTIWEEYLRTGEIHSLSGFTYRGIMSKKDVTNYPIQGSAFHCALHSCILVQQWLDRNKMGSKLIGQIHDALIFDAKPEEKEILIAGVKKIACQDLRARWPWIIVPLDMEMTVHDQNWSITKEVA